ncbi:MAG: peptidase [Gammaproteobacteria bacterium]|nr:peptidase [Gammaproteobacteria bacterium]
MMQHRYILLFKLLSLSFSGIAANLMTINVIDPMGQTRPLIAESNGEFAIVEDDILIKTIVPIKKPKASLFFKISGGYWPRGVLYYSFDPNLPDISINTINDAIQVWEMHTHAQFKKVDYARPQAHDYIVFTPDDGKRCASFVGRQGGSQVLLLAKRCNTMNVVHELGHAFGLWHEQSRLDRDHFVEIIWDNITEENWYNFNQHVTDGRDFGEYDYQSIMHYSAYAFSKNHEKTIVPLQRDVEIGQRQFLSPKDIAAVNGLCLND